MTTLAANKIRTYEGGPERVEWDAHPMVADDIIYEGSAVGLDDSGNAQPLVATKKFVGFAVQKADNTGGAAGAKRVSVKSKGFIVLPVGSAAATDVGAAVYASDDDTFTKVSTSHTFIGRIARFVSSGKAVVSFDAALVQA